MHHFYTAQGMATYLYIVLNVISNHIRNCITSISININHRIHRNMSITSLERMTNPKYASLLEYDPFDILGLNPRDPDFPDPLALREAYNRAAAHTHPFATSSTLTLPPFLQVDLAYRTLRGAFRTPARAFWRSLHRSTWNPHAPVGSVEAGLPIPGQGGPGLDQAAARMADAVAAVELDEDPNSALLLGRFYPPRRCGECGDGGGALPPVEPLICCLSYGPRGDGDCRRDCGTLPTVVLGTFLLSFEQDERANAVVGVLDRRGRYYRRVVPWTIAGEPLPTEDLFFVHSSCPPALIDYLPRFRDCSELQIIARVREQLAYLQEQEDQ
ncbi:MAG: hypothetical protein M1826_007091 [Phylliscum demangeonii]|nr:MAG: hypothetical protein M1826_007091 [Phylliscum demangeonii]